MGTSAPNLPATASQSRLVMKPQPNVSNASRPPQAIDAAAPPSNEQHEPSGAGSDQLE